MVFHKNMSCVRNRTVVFWYHAYYDSVKARQSAVQKGDMSFLRINKLFEDHLKASKRISFGTVLVSRRFAPSLIGGFLCAGLLAVSAALLHGSLSANSSENKADAASNASSNAQINTAVDPAGSVSPDGLDGVPSAQPTLNGGTSTNVSIDMSAANADAAGGGAATQVSIDGQSVPTPPNTSTTHTFTSPDGQHTTITATTTNNQSDTESHTNTSSHLSIHSNTTSSNFEVNN